MENWLALLAIIANVVLAGIAWWQSCLSRQHADRAGKFAQEANDIQAEMAERDRVRYEREEAKLREDPVLLLLEDGELRLANSGAADLSKVLVTIEGIWLELDGEEFLDYWEVFPGASAPVHNYGALSRQAKVQMIASAGRLVGGVTGLVGQVAAFGKRDWLVTRNVSFRAMLMVEYIFAASPRSGSAQYRVRGKVHLQDSAEYVHKLVRSVRSKSALPTLPFSALTISSSLRVFEGVTADQFATSIKPCSPLSRG